MPGTMKKPKMMGGGMMRKRPGYKAGEIVGKQKNLPPFLKKKILAAKPNKKTKSKAKRGKTKNASHYGS